MADEKDKFALATLIEKFTVGLTFHTKSKGARDGDDENAVWNYKEMLYGETGLFTRLGPQMSEHWRSKQAKSSLEIYQQFATLMIHFTEKMIPTVVEWVTDMLDLEGQATGIYLLMVHFVPPLLVSDAILQKSEALRCPLWRALVPRMKAYFDGCPQELQLLDEIQEYFDEGVTNKYTEAQPQEDYETPDLQYSLDQFADFPKRVPALVQDIARSHNGVIGLIHGAYNFITRTLYDEFLEQEDVILGYKWCVAVLCVFECGCPCLVDCFERSPVYTELKRVGESSFLEPTDRLLTAVRKQNRERAATLRRRAYASRAEADA